MTDDGDYDDDGIPDSQDSDFHDSDGNGIPDNEETDSGRRDSSGLETVIINGQELSKIEGLGGTLFLNSDRQVVATQEPDGDIRFENGTTYTQMAHETGWDILHGTDGSTMTESESVTGLVGLSTDGGSSSEPSNNAGTLVFDESAECAPDSGFDDFWKTVGISENQSSETSSDPKPKPAEVSSQQSRYDEYVKQKTAGTSADDNLLLAALAIIVFILVVAAVYALLLIG